MTLEGVHKRFGATRALDDAGIVLLPGEVHALVGENGAGKSTLIKVMTGIYQPDEGSITIDGVAVELASSAEAQARGIVAIYQEPMIYPDLSVAENIFIGHRNRGRLVRWRRMYDEADAILRSLAHRRRCPGLGQHAGRGSAAGCRDRQGDLARRPVLIMDEPTASLSAHEVDRLFDQVAELRRRGVAVLFISHRLDEVFRIADRITVFRDGRHISTRPAAETSRDRLVREMVGRDFGDFFVRTRHEPGETVASRRGPRPRRHVRGRELRASRRRGRRLRRPRRRRTHRCRSRPVRDRPRRGGRIIVEAASSRSAALPKRCASASPISPRTGGGSGCRCRSRWHRTSRCRRSAATARRSALLDRNAEKAAAGGFRDRLHIRTASLLTPVGNLSGGNQQKTMLAKWLNVAPRVLDPRRTDAGHRRRCQGRRPPAHRRSRS